MRNLLLTYNNTTFTVTADEDTYNDVTKDMNTLHLYAKPMYEESFGKPDEIITQNQNTEDTQESQSSSHSTKEMFKKRKSVNEETTALQSEKTQSGVLTETYLESFRWNDKMILCLLQVRLGKDAEFNNPVCKKIKLWKQVAFEITEITGITVSGEACDTKFRNLLATYRLNKKKTIKNWGRCYKMGVFSYY